MPLSALNPTQLCRTSTDTYKFPPVIQIGNIGLGYYNTFDLRLDKAIFKFKGNLPSYKVEGYADLNNLININIRKGVLQSVFTNSTSSTVEVCFLAEYPTNRVPTYRTNFISPGGSIENAEIWQAGNRVYLTEDTYLRTYKSWPIGFLKMYN